MSIATTCSTFSTAFLLS